MYVLFAALLACTCAAPSASPRQERTWTTQDPRQIVARFAGQSDRTLTPEQAFGARGRCASITRAVVTPLPAGAARRPPAVSGTPSDFAGLRVEVEGVGLERVTRIVAHLPAAAEGLTPRHGDTEKKSEAQSVAGRLSTDRGAEPTVPGVALRRGGPPPPQELPESPAAQGTAPDPSGSLADIKVVRTDGKLVFPVFCASCEVVLGFPVDATPGAMTAGCVGPGWSLRFRDGTLAGD